jgi:hypothetical protein
VTPFAYQIWSRNSFARLAVATAPMSGRCSRARRVDSRDRAMPVLIYVNSRKQIGDADHIRVLAKQDPTESWFEENDLEEAAFEYEVLLRQVLGSF